MAVALACNSLIDIDKDYRVGDILGAGGTAATGGAGSTGGNTGPGGNTTTTSAGKLRYTKMLDPDKMILSTNIPIPRTNHTGYVFFIIPLL